MNCYCGNMSRNRSRNHAAESLGYNSHYAGRVWGWYYFCVCAESTAFLYCVFYFLTWVRYQRGVNQETTLMFPRFMFHVSILTTIQIRPHSNKYQRSHTNTSYQGLDGHSRITMRDEFLKEICCESWEWDMRWDERLRERENTSTFDNSTKRQHE